MAGKARFPNDENGSVTIEFLGILPLVFFIMLICWQFLVGVYAVITAQAAANEAAKVYAVTRDTQAAMDAAENVVAAAGGGIGFASGNIAEVGSYFTAEVSVTVDLVFLPDMIRDNMKPEDRVISFQRAMTSRVIR
ncbi:pilus assembly protein [Brevibacillus sp. SYP-B805]|uniref:TadE/TadG family type IV pilus assembly protein n=1 Tax=Brevibacillus sp. SYP-B805 TaxID=1578199 RepID=UPI0013EAC461|nr:TadE/TadG family type IV pilus assembly protein [Brevibacillus sp. SYP-B805]NGQ97037.1 pilus assembly protein [Brevibacillus sp. SYP-B805]